MATVKPHGWVKASLKMENLRSSFRKWSQLDNQIDILIMTERNLEEIVATLNLVLVGDHVDDWYIASSRDGKHSAEGSWEDWIALAKAILVKEQHSAPFG